MAKHAALKKITYTPDDWLETFNTFFIYEILPQFIEMCGLYVKTQAESKKHRKNNRQMTTPIFLLRCVQICLFRSKLDLLMIGVVNDVFTAK